MIKNLEYEIGKLRDKLKKAGSDKVAITMVALLADLKLATPVDTGLAQDSWKVTPQGDDRFNVSNPVPYIDELNAGSSKQAPPFFVEKVALKYGRPVGKVTK